MTCGDDNYTIDISCLGDRFCCENKHCKTLRGVEISKMFHFSSHALLSVKRPIVEIQEDVSF